MASTLKGYTSFLTAQDAEGDLIRCDAIARLRLYARANGYRTVSGKVLHELFLASQRARAEVRKFEMLFSGASWPDDLSENNLL